MQFRNKSKEVQKPQYIFIEILFVFMQFFCIVILLEFYSCANIFLFFLPHDLFNIKLILFFVTKIKHMSMCI